MLGVNRVTRFTLKGGIRVMDVNKVSREMKLRQWMETIKACRESDMTVKQWCKEHSLVESHYYYYLKKIRTIACDSVVKETTQDVPAIVPVPVTVQSASNHSVAARFHKGDLEIEVTNDISSDILLSILKQL